MWDRLGPRQDLPLYQVQGVLLLLQGQTRNWRLHKRVCSTDPLLRPFIRVEMAVERTLATQAPFVTFALKEKTAESSCGVARAVETAPGSFTWNVWRSLR